MEVNYSLRLKYIVLSRYPLSILNNNGDAYKAHSIQSFSLYILAFPRENKEGRIYIKCQSIKLNKKLIFTCMPLAKKLILNQPI